MTGGASLVERILTGDELSILFQPVFLLDEEASRIAAVEALVRGPRGTTLHSPAVMFSYARNKGCEAELDRVCLTKAIGAVRSLPAYLDVHLNIHASSLALDPDLPAFLAAETRASGVAAERLTVEVVEHTAPWDLVRFRAAVAELRAAGFGLALDDFGRSQSNFRMLLELRPGCVKLDSVLSQGASADPYRRAVLASVVELARRIEATIVAEGIETREDLAAARRAGIDRFQGHIFWPAVPAEALQDAAVIPRPPGARGHGWHVVCAWCDTRLSEGKDEAAPVTHGICRACLETALDTLREMTA